MDDIFEYFNIVCFSFKNLLENIQDFIIKSV